MTDHVTSTEDAGASAEEPAPGVGGPLDLVAIFAALPGIDLVLAPDAPRYTMLAATDARLAATMTTRDATLGRPLFDVFPDANPDNDSPTGVGNLHASLETVLRTRAPHRMPVQRYDLQRPDGSWEERYWEPLNAPVLAPDGAVRYIVHRVEDVTARVRAEAERARLTAALEAERGRLRSLILHMPTPLALHTGPEHRHELINDAYQRISGVEREVVGLTPREAFPELAGQGIFERFDEVYATGVPWVAPETKVRYDRHGTGELEDAWFDLRYEPLREPGPNGSPGAVTAILVIAVDVTDQVRSRQQVEAALAESERGRVALAGQAEALREAARLHERTAAAEAARAAAEASNRAKSEFLTVMSHELRTPLNAIAGYAELLELGIHGPVTPEQRAALARIQQSQRHLLGLINGVLNFARVEAGAVHYQFAEVSLDDVLAACEALLAPQARAKGLTLERLAGAPLRLRTDGEKLQQVVLNLLSNAVKFTERGGRITLRARAADAWIRVHVTDTGIGIPADQLTRVFDPFVQVDASLTRRAEGTGLGLAISRDLARGMGGDLTAESTPGVGSTFTLVLPRA